MKKAKKAKPTKKIAVTSAQRARAASLYKDLLASYPDAHCELNYRNPFELLIATILSAQTTDVGVNKATPALFEKYPTAKDLAAATPAEIEPYIRTIGLYRNKAKSIHGAAAMIISEFGGEVPRTMAELIRLPGVARKTANVVMGEAFSNAEGVVVDTHVQRLTARFGLVPFDTPPPKVEEVLMRLFDRACWAKLSHLLIWHGRRICTARGNTCTDHPVCKRYGQACDRRR
jgi:endonuclease-3